jgi:hypothetical protein
MAEDELKRARLQFDDRTDEPAPLDKTALQSAMRAAGLRGADAPHIGEGARSQRPRRSRRRTGRTEQFSTRLKPETLDAIYAYADARSITLAETIELALDALLSSQKG